MASDSTWISIEVSLPPPGTTVLGCGPGFMGTVVRTDSSKRWFLFDDPNDGGLYPSVSFWMPLPDPPEALQ